MNNKFETLTAIADFLNALDPSTNRYAVVTPRADSDNCQIEINGNPERYLWFRADKNRLEISGNFNLKGTKNHTEWFGHDLGDYASITVSAEKAPEKIAQDLLRRIVPQYLEAFKRASDSRDSSVKYYRSSVNTLCAITEAAGEVFTDRLKEDINSSRDYSVYINRNHDASLRLGVRVSGDTTEITVGYLPVDKAVKLVAFLKTLAAE